MVKQTKFQLSFHILGLIFFILLWTVFQSCAPVSVQPPYLPAHKMNIREILLNLTTQNEVVREFFSNGRIRIKGPDSELEANVLILGTRNPLRFKIEVTHFWGRPVMHILITDSRVKILSFSEKQYYSTPLTGSGRLNFLPVPVDLDTLWAISRGFSMLPGHHGSRSLKPGLIALVNKTGEAIQHMEFYSDMNLPHRVYLPDSGLELTFTDYALQNNIQYARKIRLLDLKTGTMLAFTIGQVGFNKIMDPSIFELSVPSDFETISDIPVLDTE